MILRLLKWIGLVLILAACQANETEPQSIIPGSTLPPDVKADALYIDKEAERQGIEMMAANPGGRAVGFRGTYEGVVPNFYTTFRTKQGQDFVGEFVLRSGKLDEHSYVFLCLFDSLQIPCSPQADPFQFIQDVGQGDIVRIPLQIPIKSGDFHDLVVLYQEDPYLAVPIGADSFPDRTLRDLYEMRANISVEGRVTGPTLSYTEPAGQPGQGSIPYGSVASDLENPIGEQGGWIIWTETTAQAGEFLDFFLHFDSDQDRKYAVVAFVDFEQTPIYFNEEAHLPLYVQARASTWHTMSVQVRAPKQPGRYEFRLIAMVEPFAWLDSLSDGKVLTDYPKSSYRILLEVE